jgi:hypothetical protein
MRPQVEDFPVRDPIPRPSLSREAAPQAGGRWFDPAPPMLEAPLERGFSMLAGSADPSSGLLHPLNEPPPGGAGLAVAVPPVVVQVAQGSKRPLQERRREPDREESEEDVHRRFGEDRKERDSE